LRPMTGIFAKSSNNYLTSSTRPAHGGLEFAAREKGSGVIVMEPLRGSETWPAQMPPGGGKRRGGIEEIFAEADTRRNTGRMGPAMGLEPPRSSLQFFPGMNDEAHIEENLRIADEAQPDSLTVKELEIIRRVEKKFRQLMKVGCTGCRYCMPCPARCRHYRKCFDAYNSQLWGNKWEGLFRYMFTVGALVGGREPGFASRCTDCGQCEEKCPQGLQVRRHLRDAAKQFEGLKLKLLLKGMKLLLFFMRRKNLK